MKKTSCILGIGIGFLTFACQDQVKTDTALQQTLDSEIAEKVTDWPVIETALLKPLHERMVTEFELITQRFGESRMPELSHRMDENPRNASLIDREGNEWAIAKVELLGLQQSAIPVVYEPTPSPGPDIALPRPLTFPKFPSKPMKRPLDDFEQEALELLSHSPESAYWQQVDPMASRFRLLGGIRAKTACLKCHQENEAGELLGAMTYQITRTPKPQEATSVTETPQ